MSRSHPKAFVVIRKRTRRKITHFLREAAAGAVVGNAKPLWEFWVRKGQGPRSKWTYLLYLLTSTTQVGLLN